MYEQFAEGLHFSAFSLNYGAGNEIHISDYSESVDNDVGVKQETSTKYDITAAILRAFA